MFMKTKGLLPYNTQFREEPKCNSPSHLKRKQIIDVPFHNMSCSTLYETTVSIRKTTDLKSPKPIEHLTTMKDNQHTSGISLIRLVNE